MNPSLKERAADTYVLQCVSVIFRWITERLTCIIYPAGRNIKLLIVALSRMGNIILKLNHSDLRYKI
jgi:hypothetical protein